MELPDLQIEWVDIDTLSAYEHNPRLIPERAILAVADSIREFGFLQPIVVDEEGEIAAGHTRLLAAYRLELKQVPIVRVQHLTPAQIRAYRLADNRTGEYTGWDMKILAQEVVVLEDEPIPGFEDNELAILRTFVHNIDNIPVKPGEGTHLPPGGADFAPLTMYVPKSHLAEIKKKFEDVLKPYSAEGKDA